MKCEWSWWGEAMSAVGPANERLNRRRGTLPCLLEPLLEPVALLVDSSSLPILRLGCGDQSSLLPV